MDSLYLLKDKVALVFGGTRGIGLEIARAFGEHGAWVVPTSRTQKAIRSAFKRIPSQRIRESVVQPCDVRQKRQVKTLLNKVLRRYRRIDIMVYAAGIDQKCPIADVTETLWKKILQTNLDGAFLANTLVGQQMVKQKRGSIVNITSIGAHQALSKSLPYCVSKAGLLMMSQCFAAEWARHGVRVNAVTPGTFLTTLNKKALKDKTRLENIKKGTPMGRLGSLSELRDAVLYLASDQSSFTTGSEIRVDGGFLAYSGY